MSIGAQVTNLGNALQRRLATSLVWLADAIAFLSRTVWPLVDLLIRIWIGRQALVLSVLAVILNWIWSYVTYRPSTRLITASTSQAGNGNQTMSR